MFGGLDLIALIVIAALKRRFRLLAVAVALIPVVVVALLVTNEGDIAHQLPDWLARVIIFTPLVAIYATLIFSAVRLAKPSSWWAGRFYDEEKLTRARQRFGTTAQAP